MLLGDLYTKITINFDIFPRLCSSIYLYQGQIPIHLIEGNVSAGFLNCRWKLDISQLVHSTKGVLHMIVQP